MTSQPPTQPPGIESAPPSECFGKYVRTQKLGAGGMGEVWKAWDTDLRRWVALKFIKGDNPGEVARFKREAQTAAPLSHPNIAAVYDVGEAQGRPFIAMQFVPGQDLAAFPRDNRRRLVELIRDAAIAVHYAHAKGVIHRDLKPANLMVDAEGRLFVMDFGLAKQVEVQTSLSVSGLMVGTPAYMPPEQAQGKAHEVDARSDVYSLGATLYELLADRPPFQHANMLDLLFKVVEEEPAPPPGDADLGTIVLKCLDKERSRRYESAQALADDLGRWLAGEPVRARPPSAIQRAGRWIAKNRVIAAAVVGLVAVALGAGVIVVRQKIAAAEELAAEKDRLNRLSTLWMEVIERKRDLRGLKIPAAKAREGLQAAVRELDDFIKANPSLPQGWHLRARGKLYLGRYLEARADARKAAELGPDFGLLRALVGVILMEEAENISYTMRGSEAALARRQELVDEALREFAASKAGRRPPEQLGLTAVSEDAVFGLLAQALAKHSTDEAGAIADLRAAVEQRRAEEYAAWLARLKVPDADQWLERALEWAPGYVWPRLQRAVARLKDQQLDDAIADYNQVIDLQPDCVLAYRNRAVARRFKGDLDGAIADCSQAISLDPGDVGTYANRAAIRYLKGEREAAIADWDVVTGLQPDHRDAIFSRGIARRDLGDLDGAIADWTTLIAIDAKYQDVLYRRGNARQAKRDLDGAMADWTAMVKVNPDHKESHCNLGSAHSERGEFDAAIAAFDKAIAIDDRFANAYYGRCRVWTSKRNRGRAIADCEKTLEVAPRDWPYRKQAEAVLKALRGE